MAKNIPILNVVLEFWRAKCITNYVYEQCIAINVAIAQTLHDIDSRARWLKKNIFREFLFVHGRSMASRVNSLDP